MRREVICGGKMIVVFSSRFLHGTDLIQSSTETFFKMLYNCCGDIVYIYTEWGGGINSRAGMWFCWQWNLSWTLVSRSFRCCWYWTFPLCLSFFRITHPEVPYSSGASSSTNNPEFVEDLSQGQLLQNESSNTAEGSEQRHEDEVSWSISSCYWSLRLLKKQSARELIEVFILWPPYILQNILFYISCFT